MNSFTVHQLEVGQTASMTKTVTEGDLHIFAGVTGDFNPAHLDEEYAKNTLFKGRIAHGMLSAGFISAVIGTQLPGLGTIYVSQQLKFTAPVRIGDSVQTIVEVVEKNVEKNKVILKTTCINHENVVVVEGEAVVKPTKSS